MVSPDRLEVEWRSGPGKGWVAADHGIPPGAVYSWSVQLSEETGGACFKIGVLGATFDDWSSGYFEKVTQRKIVTHKKAFLILQ